MEEKPYILICIRLECRLYNGAERVDRVFLAEQTCHDFENMRHLFIDYSHTFYYDNITYNSVYFDSDEQ